ncbi:MAG: hypothetical protein ACK56I_02710, partial [bacterium]
SCCLGDIDVELLPAEPRTVTTALETSGDQADRHYSPSAHKEGGRAVGDWGMGSGVGHVEQGGGPDDQEPEGEVRGEADHLQGSYSQEAANDRSCGGKRQPQDLSRAGAGGSSYKRRFCPLQHSVQPGAGDLWVCPREYPLGGKPRQSGGWLEAAIQEPGQRKEEGEEHGEAGCGQVLQEGIN